MKNLNETIKIKKCTLCNKEKPANRECFYAEKKGENRLAARCKECSKLDSRKYYKNNIEKVKERSRKNTQNLTDSYVASLMKTPVKHLNPQIIETKRLMILIKREFRKNNQ